jgi:hypothetical protein
MIHHLKVHDWGVTTYRCVLKLVFGFFYYIIFYNFSLHVRKEEKHMAKKQNYIWKNDRNFALDDYEKQQLYYVVEANDIINKARHDLTARELKLMDFVISKIMPDDDNFHVVKTSMYELTKVLNINQKW